MSETKPPATVTVFGANDPVEGDEAYQRAREVGRVLAELGYAVANGGYAGTMEAVSRGACESGGLAIGVVCGVWKSQPNAYCGQVIRTTDLSQRIGRLIELGSDGYVVLPGATGTLVELAMVWELQCKKIRPRRPIACMGDFWRPLVDMMAAARPGSEQFVKVVHEPAELRELFPSRK